MSYIVVEYYENGFRWVDKYNSLEDARLGMGERFSIEAGRTPEYGEDGWYVFDDGYIGPWSACAYGWEWIIMEVEL